MTFPAIRRTTGSYSVPPQVNTSADFVEQSFAGVTGQLTYSLTAPVTDVESVVFEISAAPAIDSTEYTATGNTLTISAALAAIVLPTDTLTVNYI